MVSSEDPTVILVICPIEIRSFVCLCYFLVLKDNLLKLSYDLFGVCKVLDSRYAYLFFPKSVKLFTQYLGTLSSPSLSSVLHRCCWC